MRKSNRIAPGFLILLLGLSVAAFGGCDKDKKLRVGEMSPTEGPPGKKIIIHGNGFQQGGMKRVEVFFGEYRADVKGFDGDDKIIVVAPSGPKLGDTVEVKVNFIGRGSVDHLRYKYKLPGRRMTAGDLTKKKAGEKGKKEKKKDKK